LRNLALLSPFLGLRYRRGIAKTAHELSRELFKGGVLATGIGFPTVAKGKARIRTIVASTHTREELDRALEILRTVGKRLGILQ